MAHLDEVLSNPDICDGGKSFCSTLLADMNKSIFPLVILQKITKLTSQEMRCQFCCLKSKVIIIER